MRKRSAVFTTLLILAAAAITAPFLHAAFNIAWYTQRNGYFQYNVLGLDGMYWHGFYLSRSTIVGDQIWERSFYAGKTPKQYRLQIRRVDPETGDWKSNFVLDEDGEEVEFDHESSRNSYSFEDGTEHQFWIFGSADYIYRLDGETCVRQPLVRDTANPLPEQLSIGDRYQSFVTDGQPSLMIEDADGQLILYRLIDSGWKWQGVVQLLDRRRNWITADGERLMTDDVTSAAVVALSSRPKFSVGTVKIRPIGSTEHLFWNVPGQLIHRRGIELNSTSEDSAKAIHASGSDKPVSALATENSGEIANEWFVVSEVAPKTKWLAVSVDGAPAILLIDELKYGSIEARLLRFVDERWSEFARFQPPFPTPHVHAISNDDGSKAYLAADGLWGRVRMFAIEPTGFRKTDFEIVPWRAFSGFSLIGEAIVESLLAGLIFGSIAEGLMWRDCHKYAFQHRTATFATIWERGNARLIDGAIVVALVVAVFDGMSRMRNIDWLSLAEIRAVGERHHPAFADAITTVVACLLIICVSLLLLILVQGIFGATPGKWICRLRTVRTTLGSCGIARSLARELLLCLDSLNLLSWMPGIFFIAYSEHRQRFGDIVADTIVVRARSIAANQSESVASLESR